MIAAGNGASTDAIAAPACISTAISVGATTDSDTPGGADHVAGYSNVSSQIALFAPGSTITSSIPGGGFQTKNGTSMAAPHVAGAWALMKSKAPDGSVAEILSALVATGVSIHDDRPGGAVTKPRIQLDAAISALSPPETHALYLPLIMSGP